MAGARAAAARRLKEENSYVTSSVWNNKFVIGIVTADFGQRKWHNGPKY